MKPWLMSLGLALCGGVTTAAAAEVPQLVIAQPHMEIELPVDAQVADIVFPFKNASGSTVQILEIKTECDCTQGTATPAVLAAGQAGEIVLKFRPKSRNGSEVIHAKVITDRNETYPLTVSAKLRSYIEVTPQILRWKKDEPREAKKFFVSSTGLGKLHFTKVAAVRDSRVQVLPGKESEKIQVEVTPPTGDRPFQDVLVVSVTLEGSNETKVYDLQVRGE